ncbi:MAG: hypothetical protein COW84_06565 [Gammaproteobacteria bacterium CG22_combo_CG10-13_8_21_14_all_40_8]|nr:MAG: hypothetical protein COW84_06565 [Gammaproteobacteria bacterium CG22_combo_CG10-13_8_21_14_all_40_8]
MIKMAHIIIALFVVLSLWACATEKSTLADDEFADHESDFTPLKCSKVTRIGSHFKKTICLTKEEQLEGERKARKKIEEEAKHQAIQN